MAESTSPDSQNSRFLQGPQSRIRELLMAARVLIEMIQGFRHLHFVGPCVTVFGSARFPETHPWYQLGMRVGAELARAGFTVMTGGGPGIMEAANRGAKEAGGHSVGCNIVLPMEQQPNPYLDTFVDFRYFFIRKLMLAKYSYAFVALPGGFGTLDELFEIATLVQTGKMKDFPIVLVGVDYWKPMIEFLRQSIVANHACSQEDVDRFILSDSPDEVASVIAAAAGEKFGLLRGVPKARWWLFERSV